MARSLAGVWTSYGEPDEPGRGAPALRLLLALTLFAVTLAVAGPVRGQAGVDDRSPATTTVDVTLIGPEAALAPVREVTADLLARNGATVAWRNAAKLLAEDVIEAPTGQRGPPVAVWVDVSSGFEARIYFRAAAGRRFVIRRVSLPAGMGPLAAEEIAQIIQSVLRALASDTDWAMSLPEARIALSVPEQPPPAPPPAPPRATTVGVGSAVAGQLYAPGLPLVGGVDVSIAGLYRPGSFGGRLVLGYGFPAHFAAGAVGADLQQSKLRLQLVWEPWRRGRFAIRLGLGGGADRVNYTPTAELPGALPAPGSAFITAIACADAALHVELGPRLALAAAVVADVSLQRVHFDAYDADGNLDEVLIPHRVRPGLTLGFEVRL